MLNEVNREATAPLEVSFVRENVTYIDMFYDSRRVVEIKKYSAPDVTTSDLMALQHAFAHQYFVVPTATLRRRLKKKPLFSSQADFLQ